MKKDTLPYRKNYRLNGYDYSTWGNYFVTVVTSNRCNMFGHIENGIMHHNNAGMMVQDVFMGLNKHDNGIIINDIAIMPNHIHCIITLASDTGTSLPAIMRYSRARPPLNTYAVSREKAGNVLTGNCGNNDTTTT